MFGLTREPNFALLNRLRAEAREFQERIDQLHRTQAELTAEHQALEADINTEVSIGSVRKRARLRANYEATERAIADFERRLRDSQNEQRGVIEAYQEVVEYRKRLLAKAAALEPGSDLDECLGQLAGLLRVLHHYEGDAKLLKESAKLEAEIQARSPWYVLPEAWVYNSAGKLIKETELAGVGRVAFGRGAKITKDEARRLGILEAK